MPSLKFATTSCRGAQGRSSKADRSRNPANVNGNTRGPLVALTFIRFLNAIEAELPKDKAVHVILDNYAAHKQPKVRAWLSRHPRWTFHFVPTSCSWLNAVEGFFAKLTRRRLKHGVFHSVVDLQAAIKRFIKEHNQEPKPFVWKADPNEIIAAVKRGHQALESIH
ncbi:transposase [Neorhizobium galegae]|uniref:transposase n=1 Tax=Neorhizobium galegae TaxID=399 RepID=UPI00349E586E